MPLISVVMPVYNNERLMGNAIDSVLNQGYDDFEMIIVDDGSTDDTPHIADAYADKDSRIHVIHQENQWIYASFNNGIRKACGNYIYILNSDDKLYEGALPLLAGKLKEYSYPDIIWTRIMIHHCDDNQNVSSIEANRDASWDELDELYCADSETVRKSWMDLYLLGYLSNQANLYKREIVLRHPFKTDCYGADHLFNINIAYEINTCLMLTEPIYKFYQYNDSSRNSSIGKYYGYEHEMFNEFYTAKKDMFEKWGLSEDIYAEAFRNERMSNLSYEMKTLLFPACPLSTDEKIRKILDSADNVVVECAGTERREELESRLLFGLLNLFMTESPCKESEMYFVYEMTESLLRIKKKKEDMDRIKRGVFHPLNNGKLGEYYYQQLCSYYAGRDALRGN